MVTGVQTCALPIYQRAVLRNFMTNFLGFLPSERHPELLGRICTALEVAPDTLPLPDERPAPK